MNEPALRLLTVYENPKEYPRSFVVREWLIVNGEQVAGQVRAIGPDLNSVREAIPPGMVQLDRMPGDDPSIVETWV